MSTKSIECASLFDAELLIERMQEIFSHVEFVRFSAGRLVVACVD